MERGNWVVLAVMVSFVLCTTAWGDVPAQQSVTQSWHGLSGLYVIPTARVIGGGKLAMGYNESKHVEVFSTSRFMDRQIRAPFTFGIGDRFELSAVYQSNQYDVSGPTALDNGDLATVGMKLLVFSETKRRPAIALAVRDIFDQDTDAEPLANVHNGRKFFLLASKRVAQDKSTGRFLDAHIGVTNSKLKSVSGLFGFELALTPVVSFIAEGMWDSPYVNFRNSYLNPGLKGTSDVPGRFINDIGFRLYPDLLPGLTIDTGFIGDGSFEFSFGAGYVVGI